MKTLEDLFEEVSAGSCELREEAEKAIDDRRLAEFAAAHGVKTTEEEFTGFLLYKMEERQTRI